MKRSTDRILTTHVGSLIRPARLREFLSAKESGQAFDQAAYATCLRDCVADVVRRQAAIGIDVVSDGEFGKAISWAQYPLFRLGGFERRPFSAGRNPFTRGLDRTRFPEFYAELDSHDKVETVMDTVAVKPITYTGQAELQQDIDNFRAALGAVTVQEAFLPVAAPSSVIPDRKNEYYASDDDLQQAIGDAMHTEYKTIIDAGFLVQLDDARAAVSYDRKVPPKTLSEYRTWLAKQVEITNHAIKGLPPERIRYHVCWGSWPGPHTSDVPFKDIADLVLRVRAGAFSIELANPRHEHEWRLWENLKLPKDAVLIPGVISHATNIVEHPELVAERLSRYAKIVGRANVMAGTDCGFAQGPFHRRVHPSIMWAKLEALVAGAGLASDVLWARSGKSTARGRRLTTKRATRPGPKRRRAG